MKTSIGSAVLGGGVILATVARGHATLNLITTRMSTRTVDQVSERAAPGIALTKSRHHSPVIFTVCSSNDLIGARLGRNFASIIVYAGSSGELDLKETEVNQAVGFVALAQTLAAATAWLLSMILTESRVFMERLPGRLRRLQIDAAPLASGFSHPRPMTTTGWNMAL